MNFATFAGRLGRDAELRDHNGKPVLNFALAVDTGWGDKKQTLWVDCAMWGERAPKLAQYLVKGKQITVAGDVALRQYKKGNGEPGAAITCNVQRLDLQGGGGDAGQNGQHDWKAAERREREAAPQQKPQAQAGEFDDDIPF